MPEVTSGDGLALVSGPVPSLAWWVCVCGSRFSRPPSDVLEVGRCLSELLGGLTACVWFM